MVKEHSLSNYLQTAGFILYSRVLVPCEIQTALSKIWTYVTMLIDDNHFTISVSYFILWEPSWLGL